MGVTNVGPNVGPGDISQPSGQGSSVSTSALEKFANPNAVAERTFAVNPNVAMPAAPPSGKAIKALMENLESIGGPSLLPIASPFTPLVGSAPKAESAIIGAFTGQGGPLGEVALKLQMGIVINR